MSDEKSVTEREAIERERKAFVAGVCRWPDATSETPIAKIAKDAAMIYPLPPRIVPRVVTDPIDRDFEWRMAGGALQKRCVKRASLGAAWHVDHGCSGFAPSAERVAMWADLLANPTTTEVSDE